MVYKSFNAKKGDTNKLIKKKFLTIFYSFIIFLYIKPALEKETIYSALNVIKTLSEFVFFKI